MSDMVIVREHLPCTSTVAVRGRNQLSRTRATLACTSAALSLFANKVEQTLSKTPATSEQYKATRPSAKAASQVTRNRTMASRAPRPGM
eukprot:11709799-Alexandrium_andersonii.AAC.1